jgi:hypothetical protein
MKCSKCSNNAKESKTLCENCLEKLRVRNKQRREKLIAEGNCIRCTKAKTDDISRMCVICKEKCLKHAKMSYLKKAKNNLCVSCGRPNATKKKYCPLCLERSILERRAIKDKVYEAYGGYVCNCCGESEPSFLSIDHVNNDGAAQRKEIGSGGERIYKWLVKNNFPEGYQVLCMNCQWGRRKNNGICPHKLVKR